MKGLGKIYRMEKHLVHWAMESKKVITYSSMDMGYQRENLTWPQDPLVFWNEIDINDLKREFEFSTKGI